MNTAATLREAFSSGRFCYGAEVVTTRGFVPANQPSKIVELGNALTDDPRITWVSITDNPGGNVMLTPEWLGQLLAKRRAHIVVHLTCKDRNRNALESTAWRLASEGLNNILAMTGDHPKAGFGGLASGSFDLDSVSLIAMLKAMNDGLPVPGRKGEITTLPKTSFYIAGAVSPFKQHERELMPQYFKLLRKITNGAEFIYTQLGYDMRKFHEVQLFLRSHNFNLPLIGNVYLLNKTVAGMFHRNDVPGCVVSDKLLALVEKYAAGPDKGRAFFFELAAKQLAVFKGLGFAGGYLGGMAKAESFFEIINMAEKFGANDWKEFAKEIQFCRDGEFYLFERDEQTGLGDMNQLNREFLRSLDNPGDSKEVTFNYRLSRCFHSAVFTPGTPGFNFMKRIYERWDKGPGVLSRTAHGVEKVSKLIMFDCRDCGDCSLPDIAYLCPHGSCSKNQRNGPCGGSYDGRCELKDKECIWARAYERLKHYKQTKDMLQGPAVFYDANLKNSSGWANTFLGRDHNAKKEK
ncbi:MAG: methylenetetrahydrofolate reductase [Verrucomicrobia bacterium]|nr:methylenetetrahydrofolate reductase [Verrucomicrobiota bacterium]